MRGLQGRVLFFRNRNRTGSPPVCREERIVLGKWTSPGPAPRRTVLPSRVASFMDKRRIRLSASAVSSGGKLAQIHHGQGLLKARPNGQFSGFTTAFISVGKRLGRTFFRRPESWGLIRRAGGRGLAEPRIKVQLKIVVEESGFLGTGYQGRPEHGLEIGPVSDVDPGESSNGL